MRKPDWPSKMKPSRHNIMRKSICKTLKELHYPISTTHPSASLGVCRGRNRWNTHLKRRKTGRRRKGLQDYEECMLSSYSFSSGQEQQQKTEISPLFVILFPLKYTVTENSGEVSHSSPSILVANILGWLHLCTYPRLTQTEASQHWEHPSLMGRGQGLMFPSLAGGRPLKIQLSHTSDGDIAVTFPPSISGAQWAAVHRGCQAWHLAWVETWRRRKVRLGTGGSTQPRGQQGSRRPSFAFCC